MFFGKRSRINLNIEEVWKKGIPCDWRAIVSTAGCCIESKEVGFEKSKDKKSAKVEKMFGECTF
jgi:hypothetical protein